MTTMKPILIKSTAVFEVTAVFILISLGLRVFRFSPAAIWQSEFLGLPFIEYSFIILLAILIVFLTGRNKDVYGITFHKFRYHLTIAVTGLIIAIPLSALKYGFLFPKFQISYLNWDGALISAVLGILSIITILYLIKKRPSYHILPSSSPGRLFILFGFALVIALLTTPYTNRIAGFVFFLFFVGFGEELLFRGYIQSRLNLVFGRPFQLFGVHWGWGLIIASLLFGFMHYFNPYNPYHLWWVFWTFFSGLLFGLIREKTGSVVAPALIHGMPQALAVLFFGSN